jgi:hypothetical protein
MFTARGINWIYFIAKLIDCHKHAPVTPDNESLFQFHVNTYFLLL